MLTVDKILKAVKKIKVPATVVDKQDISLVDYPFELKIRPLVFIGAQMLMQVFGESCVQGSIKS